MLVISDSGPLIALAKISHLELLRQQKASAWRLSLRRIGCCWTICLHDGRRS